VSPGGQALSPRSAPHPANVLSRRGGGQGRLAKQLHVAQLHYCVTLVKEIDYWGCRQFNVDGQGHGRELVIFPAGYRR